MAIIKTYCRLVCGPNFQKKCCKALPLQVANAVLQESTSDALFSFPFGDGDFQKFRFGPDRPAGAPADYSPAIGLGDETRSLLHFQLLPECNRRPRCQGMPFNLPDSGKIRRPHLTDDHQRFLQHPLADMHGQIAKHVGIAAEFVIIPTVNYGLGDRYVDNRISTGPQAVGLHLR